MPLSDSAVRPLKKKATAFKRNDRDGLYVLMKPDGRRYWRFRYRFGDKEKLLSLGVYPEVSLAEARTRRDDARQMLRDGVGPSNARETEKRQQQLNAGNSFAMIAREWIDHRSDL